MSLGLFSAGGRDRRHRAGEPYTCCRAPRLRPNSRASTSSSARQPAPRRPKLGAGSRTERSSRSCPRPWEQGLQAIPVIDLIGGAIVRGWAIARRTGLSHRRFRQPATLSTSCTDFSSVYPFPPLSMSPISRRSSATARISPRFAFAKSFRLCAWDRQRRSGPRRARGAHRHRLDPPVIGSKSRHDAAPIARHRT
jgi:hypothetical protein